MAASQRHDRDVTLAKYDAACRALALARSTDEVMTIRNSAVALKAYAKQAKNQQLERDAIAVRMRAERRVGELMAAQRDSVGLAEGARGTGSNQHQVRVRNKPTPPTLEAAGIDKNLADRARKAAAIPIAQFERRIDSVRHNVHLSTEQPEHYTPRGVIDAVVACFGAIDLDPCSNSHTQPNVPARRCFTRADDGLRQPWTGRVYMNPPYGREIDAWIEKLCAEHEGGGVVEAIALVPARTDTQWFRRLRDYVCCFVEGRLTFVGNDDPAPFPSALFYLGEDLGRFYHHFAGLGDIWQRIEPGMFGD